jgi:hypothetical protein
MVLDWFDFILEFDFYVIHKKRIFHLLLNVLFRIYGSESENKSLVKIFEVQNLKIKSTLEKRINRKMKKMIKKVRLKRVLPDEEKKEIVKKKHSKSHVGLIFYFT